MWPRVPEARVRVLLDVGDDRARVQRDLGVFAPEELLHTLEMARDAADRERVGRRGLKCGEREEDAVARRCRRKGSHEGLLVLRCLSEAHRTAAADMSEGGEAPEASLLACGVGSGAREPKKREEACRGVGVVRMRGEGVHGLPRTARVAIGAHVQRPPGQTSC